MNFKKTVFIVWLAGMSCIVSSLTFAQQNNSPNRWEIGVDIRPLFDKNYFVQPSAFGGGENYFSKYSLFGRYLLNPDSDRKSHLRARIGYDFYTYLDTAVRGNTFDHDSHRFAFMALIGYQREFLVKGLSSLYGGVDLSFYGDFRETLWDLPNITGFENLQQRIFGFHGVIGYSYQLTGNLRFSLESSVSLSHRYYRYMEDVLFYYDDGSPRSGRNAYFSSNQINSFINPFHQILITYNF
jgi:hypothetical protein